MKRSLLSLAFLIPLSVWAQEREYLSFGQGPGKLQGEYLRSDSAPQRTSMTVAGWFRVKGYGPNWMSAFFGRDSLTSGIKEWSLFFVAAPWRSTLEVSLEIQRPDNWSTGIGGHNIADVFGWHFVAVTRSNKEWKLYVDDQSPVRGVYDGATYADSTMAIGFVPGMMFGSLYSIVDLSDWRIWESVLTADEIALERNSPRPVKKDSLWAWWPLGSLAESCGSTVLSDSGTKRIVAGP